LKSKDFYKETKRRLTRILEPKIKRNKILHPPRDGELKNEIKYSRSLMNEKQIGVEKNSS